jgi:RNA polymerase sigma factor (sigma-70 family)
VVTVSVSETPPDPTNEIERLVERWQSGDRSAGNTLFTRYYPQLMAHARRLFPGPLRRRADTVDVVQEACAAAWRSRSRFEYRDTSSFARWLFTIVEQKLWKRWRAERAQMRDILKVRRFETGRQADRSQVTPSEDLAMREQLFELENAVSELPPAYRRVVAGRYLEGKSWAELAAELGRSKEAAQMLLIRALEKLEKHYGTEGVG